MYQVLGIPNFINIILYINGALAIALATDFLGLLPGISYLRATSAAVMATSAIVFLLGQTPLFPWLCRRPFAWHVFPNIDGTYDVEIASNWPLIESRMKGEQPPQSGANDLLFRKTGTLKITARLLTISVELAMDDKYLTSDTTACSLKRKPNTPRSTLSYIYKSHVPVPKATDSEYHFGAARIDVPKQRNFRELEGTYWTNRNWHNGLNTAGRIKLRRRAAR